MIFDSTDSYISTDELSMEVDAAVKLERPLLVKGEPGTGKCLFSTKNHSVFDKNRAEKIQNARNNVKSLFAELVDSSNGASGPNVPSWSISNTELVLFPPSFFSFRGVFANFCYILLSLCPVFPASEALQCSATYPR